MSELRVLVVDDEAGIRKGIERILQDFECRMEDFRESLTLKVVSVGTGTEAIEWAVNNHPDIILLDYKLPDLHGLDIMATLKERHLESLIIMITAYASLDVAISATKSGAFDFVPKPFTPEELKNVIQKAARHIYLQRKALVLESEKKKVRFQFLSVLAHELKSPINAIDGYVDILLGGKELNLTEDAAKMLSRCRVRIEGMRRLIHDLLDITRIESGERPRHIQKVDLVARVKESLELVSEEARRRSIDIQVTGAQACIMQADPDEISIILNNLVSNAVKYNREHGKVFVELHDLDDRVEIDVTDTGIGLTEDERSRLFKEFVRIKNESTAGIEGSGLGLSTVSKLIDINGGSINLESVRGEGSRFRIGLPKQQGATV